MLFNVQNSVFVKNILRISICVEYSVFVEVFELTIE